MIYETVPDEVLREYEDPYIILEFLKRNNGEWIPAKVIQEECKLNDSQTCPSIRKHITEMIEKQHIPIIASGKGFKLTSDIEELDKYIENLESRKQGLQRRINAIKYIRRIRG